MANDYNKPINTDDLLLVLPQIVDNTDDVARMFDGVSPITNAKDKFKQFHADGYLLSYNASTVAWDDEVWSKLVFDSTTGLALLDEDANGITLTTESLTDIQLLDFTASARFRFAGNEVITALSSGFVGINKSNPSYALDVNGDINLSGNLYLNGGTFEAVDKTYVDTADANLQTQIDALSSTTGMTADAITEQDLTTSEAQFFAIADVVKKQNAGSGYVGSKVDITYNADGTITIPEHVQNINGFLIYIKEQTLTPPTAQSDENARQDFLGLEVWFEDISEKGVVYSRGCVQDTDTTCPDTGLTLSAGTFSGYATYSLTGNWQSSGDIIGNCLVWTGTGAISQANKDKFKSNSKNNVFLSESGADIQGRYRWRFIQGDTTNGAEWVSIKADDNSAYDSLYYTASDRVKPKGSLVSITNDLGAYDEGVTGYFLTRVSTFINRGEDIGIWTSITQTGGNYDTSIAYKGNCYFLPIAMVSRNRNQGAFDAEFNPDGSAQFNNKLTNGSFDSDLSGWDLLVSANHVGSFNGKNGVMQLLHDSFGEPRARQDFIAPKTGTYKCSISYYVDTTNFLGGEVARFIVQDNYSTVFSTLLTVTDSWVDATFYVTGTMGNTFSFYLYFDATATINNQVVYFDDVSVEVKAESTAECFVAGDIEGGNIASGISGRPDGLYYDEINERDVRDLRLPTFYEEVTSARCNSELNKCFSNQNRGYEAEFEITHVNPVSATLDVKTTTSNYGTTNTRLVFIGEQILGGSLQDFGSSSSISKEFIAFIKSDSGAYYSISLISNFGNTVVYLHPRHGDVTSEFTLTNQYSVILAQRTDSFSNNKISRCEIIGDPANYSFDTHIGVPNLIDVNDLSSNLLVNKHEGTKGGYKLRLNKKFVQIGGASTTPALKVLADGVELTYVSDYNGIILNGTTAGYYMSIATNEIFININGDTTFNDNAVIEVYYEGYANEFDSSVNEEVEGSVITDFYYSQSSVTYYGSILYNELIERIGVNSTNPHFGNRNIEEKVILPQDGKLNQSSLYPILYNREVSFGVNSGNAFGFFSYITNKDGLLYSVIVFKELEYYSTDWGDSLRMYPDDNITATTDDNGKVILKGTVVSKNPIGFAKE